MVQVCFVEILYLSSLFAFILQCFLFAFCLVLNYRFSLHSIGRCSVNINQKFTFYSHSTICLNVNLKKVKVAHTRLPSVWFQSRSQFLAVSLQVMWVINPAVGCHYFPPGLKLPAQPLRGLLPILLLGEQRHNEWEQFAQDCYPRASRLRFEPEPFCAWVQHANHSATEPAYQRWACQTQ